jgi:hypothetical protein
MSEPDPSTEISITAESEKVLADARSAILEVTSQLEIGLEEAVAAYWTDLHGDEMDFFVEVILKRNTADANIECLRAIIRHYGDPEDDDLWPQIREILRYRNLVVHRWRYIRAYNLFTGVVLLRRTSESGEDVDYEVSAERTKGLCMQALPLVLRLERLRNRLAVLGRRPPYE